MDEERGELDELRKPRRDAEVEGREESLPENCPSHLHACLTQSCLTQSCLTLLLTLQTVALQTLLSMGFSR